MDLEPYMNIGSRSAASGRACCRPPGSTSGHSLARKIWSPRSPPRRAAASETFRRDPEAWDPSNCKDTRSCDGVADGALAIATVTHESYHLLGYRGEAQVECYGMQSIWYAAVKLGASTSEGQRLARFYAVAIYPQRRTQTPAYWSRDCRDGGKYDLRPNSHAWPS